MSSEGDGQFQGETRKETLWKGTRGVRQAGGLQAGLGMAAFGISQKGMSFLSTTAENSN